MRRIPAAGFLPSPGQIVDYEEPGGFGIRVDSGYGAGSAISQYYDNLVAKLVVWGRDRDEAITRSRRALREFTISGIATTIPFHLAALDLPAFVAGTHHTRTVEDDMDLGAIKQPTSQQLPEDEELSERQLTVEVGGRRFVVRVWAADTGSSTPAASGRRPTPRRRPPSSLRHPRPAERAVRYSLPCRAPS